MQVSFNSNRIAFKAKEDAPVERRTEDNGGVFETGKEVWKGTLKGYEGVKTFAGGAYRGVKNAVYAGSALVGIDWLCTSCRNNVSAWKMIKTPFSLAGKALYRGASYFVDFCRPTGPSIPQAAKDLCKTVGKVFSKIYHSKNISPVARWGLPIIATAVAGYTIIRSKLDYNERAAQIDHRYGGVHGHQDAE